MKNGEGFILLMASVMTMNLSVVSMSLVIGSKVAVSNKFLVSKNNPAYL